MADRSPFTENSLAHELAEALGMTVKYASRSIEIVDAKSVIAAGFELPPSKEPRVDYAKLRRYLEAGGEVSGAKLGGFEYVIRPRTGG